MAVSESHTWGQIIGNLFQESVKETLQKVAGEFKLYLDFAHERECRKGSSKVSWKDKYGNGHDLDYVFEKGGTEQKLGIPVAFVEAAWRSYTKHSKAKAQEIESAVIPVCETFAFAHPFRGAILSGDFTRTSLQQLRSKGFSILYIESPKIFAAFEVAGIDAAFGEKTPENELNEKVAAFRKLPADKRELIKKAMVAADPKGLNDFLAALRTTLGRQIALVVVTALHGASTELVTVLDAIAFLKSYEEASIKSHPFARYHIYVRYSNGDKQEAEFRNRERAIAFLQSLA